MGEEGVSHEESLGAPKDGLGIGPGGWRREAYACRGRGGCGRHRGLAAEERHRTLDVILHGRLCEGGGDFAATLDLLLRHNPDQVLAVVEREAACTARRTPLVAAHLGTARRVLAWRLARRALL